MSTEQLDHHSVGGADVSVYDLLQLNVRFIKLYRKLQL